MLQKMTDARAINISLSDRTKCECVYNLQSSMLARGHVLSEREQSRPDLIPFERANTDMKGEVTLDFWG